jgi:hypothetical protein
MSNILISKRMTFALNRGTPTWGENNEDDCGDEGVLEGLDQGRLRQIMEAPAALIADVPAIQDKPSREVRSLKRDLEEETSENPVCLGVLEIGRSVLKVQFTLGACV